MSEEKKKHKTGIFIFGRDLRLVDNSTLNTFCQSVENAIFLYHWSPQIYWCNQTNYSETHQTFLLQCLDDVNAQLNQYHHSLSIVSGDLGGANKAQRFQYFSEALDRLVGHYGVSLVARSKACGSYEADQKQQFIQKYPEVEWLEEDTATLFSEDQLPFDLAECPKQFTPFRKKTEKLKVAPLVDAPTHFPKVLKLEEDIPHVDSLESHRAKISSAANNGAECKGGEAEAQKALQDYFSQSGSVLRYKETRNALDEKNASTRLSPWLATGCLSARQFYHQIKTFEREIHANDSTYWLYFELLWREFFHWRAYVDGDKLFRLSGIQGKRQGKTFYPQRFAAWSAGTTSSDLVNACMHQLVETGWMSNRGRQIVASFLIYDLQLDWRYGAAFFEKHLLDNDVASNYGNWQYIAGVGTDPRGGRRFSIEKQVEQYDPDGVFRRRWRGVTHQLVMDQNNAADWPFDPEG